MGRYVVELKAIVEAESGDLALDLGWEASQRAFPKAVGQIEIKVRSAQETLIEGQAWPASALEETPVKPKEDSTLPQYQVTVMSRMQTVLWQGMVRAANVPDAIEEARAAMRRKNIDLNMVAAFNCKGVQ